MTNINYILDELASKRPVFHNEDDFKFSLAWIIKENYPDIEIRLEYPYKDIYYDIVLYDKGKMIPIELKYKTKAASINIHDEIFNLKNHGALNHSSYDVFRDVERIEKFVFDNENSSDLGYMIFLTNVDNYYDENKRVNESTNYFPFRLNENRSIIGDIAWNNDDTNGVKGRERPIKLKHLYNIGSNEFKTYGELSNEFKYMIFTIKK